MKNIGKKVTLLLIFSLIITFSISVYADIGPKSKLSVYLDNPPKEEYYLDLLSEKTGDYDNLRQDRDSLDKSMLTLLGSMQTEGWYPCLAEGTAVPLFGKLTGVSTKGKMLHSFSYFGVPDTYRIIIVTKSGKVSVSQVQTRDTMQSSVTVNYDDMHIKKPSIFFSWFIQFLSTCIPTLIIEGIILLLFGFKLDSHNLKIFLIANIATQIALSLTMGLALIKAGYLAAWAAQFPAEILIMSAEAVFYSRFLTGKSKKRAVVYGVIANAATWIIGFYYLPYQYEIITRFL